jgi:1-acyl-sn-glycerol-3-phosphate acyltransferase
MSIDGFLPAAKDAFVGFSARSADRFYRALGTISEFLKIEVAGTENIPESRALLVANHAFGWDVAFAIAAIRHSTKREVFALGEHAWWKVPILRLWASSVGVVDGTAANVDRLLSDDRLVLVQPGGLREALKPRELRYHLLWGHRYGFVRAAIRNRAPLVPLACIGADDLFDFVGNAYRRGEKVLGGLIPLPLPARILPIPHRVHLRYVIGKPVWPTVGPEQESNMAACRHLRREIEGALHELIETELAKRAGLTV